MKKILFLHGFFASGQCVPAQALRESFEGRAEVLTPDLPIHPKEAMNFIRELIDYEKPNLLVGNSCGSFYAQMLAPVTGIPALLGNPHFQMTEFLRQRTGSHEYKSPRKDGNQKFIIDEALIQEFSGLEAVQFNYCSPYYKDKVWGLFGEQDTLAHYESLFLEHYNQSFHFPGGHTPTAEEVSTWYVPLVEKMLMQYPFPENGSRQPSTQRPRNGWLFIRHSMVTNNTGCDQRRCSLRPLSETDAGSHALLKLTNKLQNIIIYD